MATLNFVAWDLKYTITLEHNDLIGKYQLVTSIKNKWIKAELI